MTTSCGVSVLIVLRSLCMDTVAELVSEPVRLRPAALILNLKQNAIT